MKSAGIFAFFLIALFWTQSASANRRHPPQPYSSEILWTIKPQEVSKSDLAFMLAILADGLAQLPITDEFPFFSPLGTDRLVVQLAFSSNLTLDLIRLNVRSYRTPIGRYPLNSPIFRSRLKMISRTLEVLEDFIRRNGNLIDYVDIAGYQDRPGLPETPQARKIAFLRILARDTPMWTDPVLRSYRLDRLNQMKDFYEAALSTVLENGGDTAVLSHKIRFAPEIPRPNKIEFLEEMLFRIQAELRLRSFLTTD